MVGHEREVHGPGQAHRGEDTLVRICLLRSLFKTYGGLEYRAREAMRGHFSDLNRTRKHGGKTWIAPKVMIREDVSLC